MISVTRKARIDQTMLVSVDIAERQRQENIQFTLGLARSWLRCLIGPGLGNLLIVAPMVCGHGLAEKVRTAGRAAGRTGASMVHQGRSAVLASTNEPR